MSEEFWIDDCFRVDKDRFLWKSYLKDGTELVQRPDDTEEVLANRLENYHQQTEPLVDYYKKNNTVYDFDADRDPGDVKASMFEKLDVLVKA